LPFPTDKIATAKPLIFFAPYPVATNNIQAKLLSGFERSTRAREKGAPAGPTPIEGPPDAGKGLWRELRKFLLALIVPQSKAAPRL
jgi:hypothetical protein